MLTGWNGRAIRHDWIVADACRERCACTRAWLRTGRQSDSACEGGEAGYTTWTHGPLACYLSPTSRSAKVRWTDIRTKTYWLSDATHGKLTHLARWWRDEPDRDR